MYAYTSVRNNVCTHTNGEAQLSKKGFVLVRTFNEEEEEEEEEDEEEEEENKQKARSIVFQANSGAPRPNLRPAWSDSRSIR